MNKHRFLECLVLVVVALSWGMGQGWAQSPSSDSSIATIHKKMKKVTQADRQAAAERVKEARAAILQRQQSGALAAPVAVTPEPVVGQGDVPDYYSATVPNWNYSPRLEKFVDTLPELGPGGVNTLGQYLPIGVPDTGAYPGLNPGDPSDYYEIGVVQYQEQMHTNLPATALRGYVQIDTPAIPDTPTKFALTYPDGSPILDAVGNQVYGVDKPHYLGPVIFAQRNVPVRIKLYNYLRTDVAGDLFIPVDPSVMGAGMGPAMFMAHHAMAMGTTATIMTMDPHGLEVGDKVMLQGFEPEAYNGYFTIQSVPSPTEIVVQLKSDPGGSATVLGDVIEMYTENRAVLHLHGGRTPWISDGTPHQWITPAGENTSYPQGVSVVPVPDMADTGDPRDGITTYYYTNQQSARLMFYHDHVYGITRLNVYAGEAAGYLIRDSVEQSLAAGGFIPEDEIHLIIQDKTFVDAATIGALDPTWRWGTGPENPDGYPEYKTGDLWVPHVYMPAQNPYDISGMAAMGRWHYGPWFWPPTTGIAYPPIPNPYYDPINWPWEGAEIPDVPDPSMGMEAFNDTPLVNGTAYPTLTVDPKSYRFRILSAANDRFFNLQLYEADPAFVMPVVGMTEVKMVAASPYPSDPTWPQSYTEGNPTWPVDGREGGVPDWNMRGPDWIQIGTEGGFLPMPAVLTQRPVDWNVDVTTFDAGLVNSHSLLLGPAERADVIVDFTAFAGKTLILYNDAPAAFPAPDPRYDYYTGMPDMTDTGGHYPTDPGFGPNTRTIMQIKVNTGPVTDPWLGLTAMTAKWESTATQIGVFEQDQDPIIVTQGALVPGYDQYNKAYNATFPNTWPNWGIARIFDTSLRFQTLDSSIVTIPMQPKAIQDEMGETFDDHGRMSGKLGLQLANPQAGGQTFVMQSYPDPATEVITTSATPLTPPLAGNGTQIWKITHNGVDVHPIHFHLFDVQLINRVAWDNNIRLPDANELGWKETVRVNPLQDTIVALRPVLPALPFGLPDSVRLLDPTVPEGDTWQSFDPYTGAPVTITNIVTNFGLEYMWHCHILSHEEMEMMRPIVLRSVPPAPIIGTAVAGNAQATVNFSPPVGTGGSPILYYTATSNPGGISATGTGSPIVVTGLTNGTTYTFTVTATNAIGTGPASAPSNAVTPAGALAAPSNLVATPSTLSSRAPTIRLTWTINSTNEQGFTIQRALNSSFTQSLTTFGVGAGVSTFTNTSVVKKTKYYYRVRAYNASGNSAWSNTASATTPGIIPAAPTNLRVTGRTRTSISLAWTDNATNELGFYIQRRNGTGVWVIIVTLPANRTTYTNTGLTPNRSYLYRIAAYNADGTTAYTNAVTGTTLP